MAAVGSVACATDRGAVDDEPADTLDHVWVGVGWLEGEVRGDGITDADDGLTLDEKLSRVSSDLSAASRVGGANGDAGHQPLLQFTLPVLALNSSHSISKVFVFTETLPLVTVKTVSPMVTFVIPLVMWTWSISPSPLDR